MLASRLSGLLARVDRKCDVYLSDIYEGSITTCVFTHGPRQHKCEENKKCTVVLSTKMCNTRSVIQ